MIMCDKEENISTIDKIVTIWCALCNHCESVVSFDYAKSQYYYSCTIKYFVLSCYVRIANTMLELSVSLATVWTKPVSIGNFFHCHADTRQVELFYSAAAMITSNQTVKVFILPIQ